MGPAGDEAGVAECALRESWVNYVEWMKEEDGKWRRVYCGVSDVRNEGT